MKVSARRFCTILFSEFLQGSRLAAVEVHAGNASRLFRNLDVQQSLYLHLVVPQRFPERVEGLHTLPCEVTSSMYLARLARSLSKLG